jgi:hypothetical protein
VWPLLAERHVTIAVCRDNSNGNADPGKVPGSWYITNVLPWAPGQIIVWVGPQPVYQGG